MARHHAATNALLARVNEERGSGSGQLPSWWLSTVRDVGGKRAEAFGSLGGSFLRRYTTRQKLNSRHLQRWPRNDCAGFLLIRVTFQWIPTQIANWDYAFHSCMIYIIFYILYTTNYIFSFLIYFPTYNFSPDSCTEIMHKTLEFGLN